MNSSLGVVWAAQGSNEEKKLSISEQLLRVFFLKLFVVKNVFDFLKILKSFKKYCSVRIKSGTKYVLYIFLLFFVFAQNRLPLKF